MANPTQVKFQNSDVASTFQSYPSNIADKLLQLRELVYETATELGLEDIEETLKWGEPSYISKSGSTLRMAWRASKPKQYALFFNCKTSLVETFKEIHHDTFQFEGNRAIVFNEDETVPTDAIKQCIEITLTYHKIKHLPLLGV